MNSVSSYQILAGNWEIIILKIRENNWGSCYDFRLKNLSQWSVSDATYPVLIPTNIHRKQKKVIGQNKVFQYGSMKFYKDCRKEVWNEIMWFNLYCGCINIIIMCFGEKYIELIQEWAKIGL